MERPQSDTPPIRILPADTIQGEVPHLLEEKNKPVGPQLWAVLFSLAGLYYLWTRVLGRPIPSSFSRLFGGSGHRIGASTTNKGHGSTSSQAIDIRAVRERQQQRLQTTNCAKEMVEKARERNVRERSTAASAGNSKESSSSGSDNGGGNSTKKEATLSIQDRLALQKQQQLQIQKQRALEEKKRKQRQLYLKTKAQKEKEEEERRKDEELGPGWRYREDPSVVAEGNAINGMDPQGEGKGGGYKPQSCTRKGG
mmetsp:Transcript_5094/g.10412  ORF Transcript_5094/g.10412 Transcript_5094/m.10412 type:complete len:254 (+) Transcript_5094:239-1000(+)